MKSARHQAILDLIEKYPIDRQEDLLEHLRRARQRYRVISGNCAW